jgi:hypothetical protein
MQHHVQPIRRIQAHGISLGRTMHRQAHTLEGTPTTNQAKAKGMRHTATTTKPMANIA